jgi:hypothetical protein
VNRLAGAVAIARLEAFRYVIGPEQNGHMVAVRRRDRPHAHVWLETRFTPGVSGDASDAGDRLLLDVIEALDGQDARERARIEWGIPLPSARDERFADNSICMDCARIVPRPEDNGNPWTLPHGIRCSNCGRELGDSGTV